MEDSLFDMLIDHLPTIQDDMALRIEALRHCQTKLDDRSKRIVKMRYELNISVEKISNHLELSRRHVYHILGQINQVLLRCMQKTMAAGGHSL